MTSGSVRSASSASRAEMLAELQYLDDEQIHEILEARRIDQKETSGARTETAATAAGSSATTSEITTRAPWAKNHAGNFARAYAANGLATEHAKLFDIYKDVDNATTGQSDGA